LEGRCKTKMKNGTKVPIAAGVGVFFFIVIHLAYAICAIASTRWPMLAVPTRVLWVADGIVAFGFLTSVGAMMWQPLRSALSGKGKQVAVIAGVCLSAAVIGLAGGLAVIKGYLTGQRAFYGIGGLVILSLLVIYREKLRKFLFHKYTRYTAAGIAVAAALYFGVRLGYVPLFYAELIAGGLVLGLLVYRLRGRISSGYESAKLKVREQRKRAVIEWIATSNSAVLLAAVIGGVVSLLFKSQLGFYPCFYLAIATLAWPRRPVANLTATDDLEANPKPPRRRLKVLFGIAIWGYWVILVLQRMQNLAK
jgi:hypothetical protein